MPSCRRVFPLFLFFAATVHGFASAAVDWNRIALESLVRTQVPLLESERALAIVEMAAYEAANATSPTYQSSGLAVPGTPTASIEAAIIEASYQALIRLEHTPDPALKLQHDTALAAILDPLARASGIATGAAAASAALQSRAHDGTDWSTTYTPVTGPGAYLPTSDQPMAGPLVFRMRPFALSSYADLRPPPPAPLDSPQMKRDLEETATLGAANSTVRTPEQTEIGRFHRQPGVYSWNSIARQAAEQRHMDEVHAASLLVAVNIAIVDAHFSVWDAKYAYNLWRPATAIRNGGGPLKRTPDPAWESLVPAPMHPEYPCAHCALGASVCTVLESIIGLAPLNLAVVSNGVERHYTSFHQYADEESVSRIYAGVHLRWSNYAGEALGRQVGERVLAQRPATLSHAGSPPSGSVAECGLVGRAFGGGAAATIRDAGSSLSGPILTGCFQ